MAKDFTKRNDPLDLFDDWLKEATTSEINDPNAVALATVDEVGMPDVRVMLLKGYDERGFVFYTNFESTKGVEMLGSMKAAMGFHWKSLRRQVRIRGPVEIVSDAEADTYYKSRPPQSRRGAWASKQSRPLQDRQTLVQCLRDVEAQFPDDNSIPRPPHWSGFRIIPQSIEFWQDGDFRLHDRIVFSPDGQGWSKQQLYP